MTSRRRPAPLLPPPVTLVTAALTATAGAVAVSEFVQRRAAGQHNPPAGDVDVVVVLGTRGSRDGGPSPMQIRRVDAGARAMRAFGAHTMIFTGSSVRTLEAEAKTMAALGFERGVAPDQCIIEADSTTTWENVHNVHGLVGPTDRILLVSNPLHAARARRHWLGQFPTEGGRVFTVTEARPLRDWPRTLVLSAYETVAALRHLRRDPTVRHSKADSHSKAEHRSES